METLERRYFSPEIRADKESRMVEGTATTFNQFYDMGWFAEKIDERAFDKVLKSKDNDTIAAFNHNWDAPLARTLSGTLTLEKTENGLGYRFESPNTTAGNDLLVMLERGDVKHSSLAMRVKKDLWETREEDGVEKEYRTILEVSELRDVSPVVFPANPNTDVAKRSRDEQIKPPEPIEIDYKTKLANKKIQINKSWLASQKY